MVTILTPVYNRKDTMSRLYTSLLMQTNYDFEWLVVDDGSTDGVGELIYKWGARAPFPIRFYRQENRGKHCAVNKGVELAHGDTLIGVDSDDWLLENAVQLIHDWWESVSESGDYIGVAGLCINSKREIIGGRPAFKEYVDATNLQRGEYGLLGDKAEAYKTSILRKYPFPEFEKEKFITEAVVLDQIAYDGWKLRYFNQPIKVIEYRCDGLTKQGKNLFIRNPKGWGLYIQQSGMFYNLSDREMICNYLDYYIELRGSLSDQEMEENLSIDRGTLEKIKRIHQICIQETIQKVGSKIALYGVGARGRKLLKIFQGTGVEICFILDKSEMNLPYKQISLSEEYPPVDVILVTPYAEQEEIVRLLKKRTQNKIIRYDQWIRLMEDALKMAEKRKFL